MSECSTIELFITIENTLGIHARPASMFVQLATQFESDVIVKNGDDEIDGKSLMGLLMLAAGKGAQLTLIFSGSDAEKARDAFHDLVVVRKFDEK